MIKNKLNKEKFIHEFSTALSMKKQLLCIVCSRKEYETPLIEFIDLLDAEHAQERLDFFNENINDNLEHNGHKIIAYASN